MFAQDAGIQFEQTLDWQQILAKAKSENKYILVDIYATWCGPCKAMDQNVYIQPQIGEITNRSYLAVKVQMDSTNHDDARIKQWYNTAHYFQKQYNITSLPSFIFFSPNGEAVHKAMGYIDSDKFKNLLFDAMNPEKQFFTRLNQYKENKLPITSLAELSNQAKSLGYKQTGNDIAIAYKKNYLDKLSDEDYCTKENFEFINRNWDILSSNDRFFKLCYYSPNKVDSVRHNIAQQFVNYLVTREELTDKLWMNNTPISKNPNWSKLENNIRQKYKKVDAKELVMEEQLRFYKRIEDWKSYANYRDKKIAEKPVKVGTGFGGDAWGLNADAWDVFLQCTDKEVLGKALNWINLSIKTAEESKEDKLLYAYYDTKASILYKLGQKDKALPIEEKALEMAKALGDSYDELSDTIDKMKKNEPIYDAKWD